MDVVDENQWVSKMHRPIPGWRPSTPPIIASNFDDIVRSHSVVAIHFWAQWNGVDPPFDLCIQSLPTETKHEVHFVSCDVDDPDTKAICCNFDVVNIPFLGIIVDGERREGTMGLCDPQALEVLLRCRLRSSTKSSWWPRWRIAK